MKTKSNRTFAAAVTACALALAPAAALAGPTGNVQSNNIRDADGTSGQSTTTGSGVKTGHLQNLAVTTAKIADGAVTAAKLAPGTVGTGAIAPGAVGTAAIADGAVTAAKVAPTTDVPVSIAYTPGGIQQGRVIFPHFDTGATGGGDHDGIVAVEKPGLDGAHVHAEVEGFNGSAHLDMYDYAATMNLRSPNTSSSIEAWSFDDGASVEINAGYNNFARLEAGAAPGQGGALILSSPNGARWIITVSDAGVLSVTPQ